MNIQEKFMASPAVEALEEKLLRMFSSPELCTEFHDPDMIRRDSFRLLSPIDLDLLGTVKEILGEDQYHIWIGLLMKSAKSQNRNGVRV
jgi:hypothetical protein